MHIVCPQCHTINRVAPDQLPQHPTCGRCGAEVAPAHPVALDDATLPRYLAKTEGPVVVDFWASWCGPCRSYAPQFAQAAQQRPDLRFVKVDSDASPQASQHHAVRSIPTTLLFEGGQERARISGALSTAQLLQWVQAHRLGGNRPHSG